MLQVEDTIVGTAVSLLRKGEYALAEWTKAEKRWSRHLD